MKMAKPVVSFGEIMLRLTPPNLERILQSPMFEASFGGGEANVAVTLAGLGQPARYVTVLPPHHPVADAEHRAGPVQVAAVAERRKDPLQPVAVGGDGARRRRRRPRKRPVKVPGAVLTDALHEPGGEFGAGGHVEKPVLYRRTAGIDHQDFHERAFR